MKSFGKIVVAAAVAVQSTLVTIPAMASDQSCTCAAPIISGSDTVGSVNVLSGTATFTGSQGPIALKAGQNGALLLGSEVTTGRDSLVSIKLGSGCSTTLKSNSIVSIGNGTSPSSVCIKSANAGQDVLNGQGTYGADLVLDEEVGQQQDPGAAPVPSSSPNIVAGLLGLAVIGGIIAFAVSDSSASD